VEGSGRGPGKDTRMGGMRETRTRRPGPQRVAQRQPGRSSDTHLFRIFPAQRRTPSVSRQPDAAAGGALRARGSWWAGHGRRDAGEPPPDGSDGGSPAGSRHVPWNWPGTGLDRGGFRRGRSLERPRRPDSAQRSRRVRAHERFLVGQRRHRLRRAPVPERHRDAAQRPPQPGPLHRRALEPPRELLLRRPHQLDREGAVGTCRGRNAASPAFVENEFQGHTSWEVCPFTIFRFHTPRTDRCGLSPEPAARPRGCGRSR